MVTCIQAQFLIISHNISSINNQSVISSHYVWLYRHSKGDREKTHTKSSKSKTDVQAEERGKHGRDDEEKVRTVRVKEEGRAKVKEEKVVRLKEEGKELERASSVTSSGSHGSQRRSAEPSPHRAEDRGESTRVGRAVIPGILYFM